MAFFRRAHAMPSREHILNTQTWVPRPREEVFAFFSRAENLERITPPELNFRIVTPPPLSMEAGTRIEYRLRLFGVPFQWISRIRKWEPESTFIDEQVKGPYATWVHTHTFQSMEGGTRVTDEVSYMLPWFPLGEIAHPLVRLQLKRIFGFRTRRLRELFDPGGSDPKGTGQ